MFPTVLGYGLPFVLPSVGETKLEFTGAIAVLPFVLGLPIVGWPDIAAILALPDPLGVLGETPAPLLAGVED
jgi:hypothetical protein